VRLVDGSRVYTALAVELDVVGAVTLPMVNPNSESVEPQTLPLATTLTVSDDVSPLPVKDKVIVILALGADGDTL
jgi:hypothetical protein